MDKPITVPGKIETLTSEIRKQFVRIDKKGISIDYQIVDALSNDDYYLEPAIFKELIREALRLTLALVKISPGRLREDFGNVDLKMYQPAGKILRISAMVESVPNDLYGYGTNVLLLINKDKTNDPVSGSFFWYTLNDIIE